MKLLIPTSISRLVCWKLVKESVVQPSFGSARPHSFRVTILHFTCRFELCLILARVGTEVQHCFLSHLDSFVFPEDLCSYWEDFT
jgi:hypothetical protein